MGVWIICSIQRATDSNVRWHFCIERGSGGAVLLQWCHNELAGVSNHQPHGCLLNRLFTRRSHKTSKLRVTGLCVGNSPVTGGFPAQRASNAENVFIWWCHHIVSSNRFHFCWRSIEMASKKLKCWYHLGFFFIKCRQHCWVVLLLVAHTLQNSWTFFSFKIRFSTLHSHEVLFDKSRTSAASIRNASVVRFSFVTVKA